MILAALTFVICFGIVYGVYWLFVVRQEALAAGAVQRRLDGPHGGAVRRKPLLRETETASATAWIDALLWRWRARTQAVDDLLQQAQVRMTVGTLVALSAGLAVLVFVLVNLTGWMLPAIAAGATAGGVPVLVIRFLRDRRIRRFEEQFPEALDLVSRALRAGHTLPTGIEMVATEMADPVAAEFRILFDQQTYGMPLPDALRALAHRIPLLDTRFFVTAVLIQREAGGNLSEIVDNLAGVMRERFRVKRQMRVLSAQGRISGWILVCLPPAVALVMFALNEEQRTLMLYDPLGQRMLAAAAGLQVIGTLLMRKIVNVEY